MLASFAFGTFHMKYSTGNGGSVSWREKVLFRYISLQSSE